MRNGAPFDEMPEPLRRIQLHVLPKCGGDRVMANLLAMIPIHGLDAVLVAIELNTPSQANVARYDALLKAAS